MSMAHEIVPFGTKTCPRDGGDLHHLTSMKFGSTDAASYLECQKCHTKYKEGYTLDQIAPAWAQGIKLSGSGIPNADVLRLNVFGSTQEIESAQAETRALRQRIERLETSLAVKPSPSDESVRKDVGEIRKELEGVDARIDKAKEGFVALLPDATDLAYLKIAKADASEIRHLITNHVEDDHRRQTLDIAGSASVRSWIAIGISVVGLVLAFWKSSGL